MRVGSGNFWQFLRLWGNSNAAGSATDAASARTALGLGALAVKNTIDSSALIDPAVVQYSDIQNVSATARLLGRQTAGAGTIEELAVSLPLSIGASGLASTLSFIIYQDQRTNGTNAGAPTASAWTKRQCDDLIVNNSVATFSTNVFTFPSGKWFLIGCQTCYNPTTSGFTCRIRNTTDSTNIALTYSANQTGMNHDIHGFGFLDASGGSKNVEMQYFTGAATANGLGIAAAPGTELEVYSTFVGIRIG